MDEVLVPLIKVEASSDDEADPLSPNTSPRYVKVGYVKTFIYCENIRFFNTMCEVRTFMVVFSVP
jgi:hypothetical protein